MIRKILIAAFYGAMLMGGESMASIDHKTYFPPNSPQGNVVNISYQFDDTHPAKYFKEMYINYRFDDLSLSPVGTRYAATQFYLDPLDGSGGGDAMYIGINPPQIYQDYAGQFHFSYFGAKGGTLYSSNCSEGADGGGGITCAYNLPALQWYTYQLHVFVEETTDTHTILSGWVYAYDPFRTDRAPFKIEIGKFEILRGNMGLSYPVGWVEGSSDPCSALVYTEITYGLLHVVSTDNAAYSVPIDTIPSNKCGVTAMPEVDGPGTTLFYGNVRQKYPLKKPQMKKP